MAAPDETAVDETDAAETPAPSMADRLGRFMHSIYGEVSLQAEINPDPELEAAWDEISPPEQDRFVLLAERVLRDFFRVDVDATSIYATPGVDIETLEGFSMVHWGPMAGRLSPDELRAIGGVFIETAEASDLDSAMVRWLLRDPGATRDGAARILASFRVFRAELDGDEEPLETGAAAE